MKHYGNFYIGIGAGAGIPTEPLSDAYNSGVAVTVPIGWDSPTGPLGFRVDLGYTRLDARTTFRNTGLTTAPAYGTSGQANIAATDPQIWSALANLKLRLPFSHDFAGPRSSLYLVGGGGVNYFRNYNANLALTNPEFNTSTTMTPYQAGTNGYQALWRGAADAGGGVSWAFRATEVFLESRYVTTFTDGRRASFVPITLGLAFH
jgi:hypothetical protein